MITDIPRAVGFLVGFWLALVLVSPIGTAHMTGASNRTRALEDALHAEVNALRRDHHLVPLERDARLDAVARRHSEDMARRGYFAHETPEGDTPVDRLAAAGVEGFRLAAENLGRTQGGEPNRDVLAGWLSSAVHRNNLLAPVFNGTGIGVVRGPDGALYYTQLYVTWPR